MKLLCLLLSLLLLLTGCDKAGGTTESTDEHKENTIVQLDIYAINDLHGKLVDTADQPGVDELSAYLKQAEQAGNTLLLATGDMWQGAAESNLTGGNIVTEWMNEMGFAAMTLGGHEYDWGEEQIRQNRELAAFPFLGINIYNRATNERVDYCQSSVVVEVDGAQIGIIGAIGNCYYSIDSAHTQDVYFKTGDALTALVKAEAEALREQGVDCIVYAIHDGYDQNSPTADTTPIEDAELADYYDVALSDGYVDLVFEADTHFRYTLIDHYGVYHLQAGGNNDGISHAQVAIDTHNGQTSVTAAQRIAADTYSAGEDDPIVEQLLDRYRQQIHPGEELVGTNSRYRGKDQICRLVANLYRTKGEETWGAEYDIVLGGGYISCRSPGHLPAGEVRYSHLMSLLPFDNQIVLCSIRGRDLMKRFLETDNEAYYVRTTDYYEEIRNSIDPNGVYYVVTDTYSANYSYNNLTIIDTYAEDVFARDLVAEYIAAGGWE